MPGLPDIPVWMKFRLVKMLDYTEGVDPNYAHVIKFDEQKPAADFEQFGDKRRSIDIKGSSTDPGQSRTVGPKATLDTPIKGSVALAESLAFRLQNILRQSGLKTRARIKGHIRSSCALAVRLTAERNIIITIIMPPNWLQQAQADVAAQFPSGHEALERIRILSSFDSTESDPFALMPLSIEHYPIAYEILLAGTIFALVAPPSALILDIFVLQQLYATRSITGTIIPIFTFVAGNAGPLVGLFGPESMDGKGHLGAKIDAEALRVVKSVEETGDQVIPLHHIGKVLIMSTPFSTNLGAGKTFG
ncbi:hypothetical protein B0H13DRAFT_2535981 [Mycena leptocephala]|nr:hypothetical protein B0H13DRAFT_2535981 [Mycena leptocephala]